MTPNRVRPDLVGLSVDHWYEEEEKKKPGWKATVEATGRLLAAAERLKIAREKAKITQAEIAKRCGTTQSSIARMESLETIPGLELLAKYAAALGLSLTIELAPAGKKSARRAGIEDLKRKKARSGNPA
jgi:DNA-binding XRE family transcriptional regulator